MLIDTHCHFNHERFAEDVAPSVERALDVGVGAMIVVGYDLPSSETAVHLAERYECLYASIGIHPHEAKSWSPEIENRLRDLTLNPRVVAVGEIGLDYHYDFSPREDQQSAFLAQLTLAKSCDLPVIIHCREAYPDTLAILADTGAARLGAVMHCWAGDEVAAERADALGLYLGFGGVLTFKNAGEVRQAARVFPLERLLVETDAPYLAPVPYRGRRNEPAYVTHVVEALAGLRDLSAAALAHTLEANTYRLFSRLTALRG